ncbi:hypothetical protein EPO17_01175 [Patescibacteria group bacterium]|nr:MAG: hypothetical protein EPO17_01175 [Patescibacteria group bacterium]
MTFNTMKRSEYIAFIFAHFALFVVFVWFGSLKFFDLSPANPLVEALLSKTLPFISFKTFIMFLGAWEVLIGILFIIPKMEKVALILLIPHMITTIMPLFLLPEIAWQGFLVPTLEGQYIIKNIVIIGLAASMFADLKKKHLK